MSDYFSQHGQDQYLDEIVFQHKRNGVFVEIGAADGLGDSNTAFFERHRGWTGLLIEAVPGYEQSLRAHRSAQVLMTAICDHHGTSEFQLVQTPGWSGIPEHFDQQHEARAKPRYAELVMVDCMPLFAALEHWGIGGTRIDYISIDIEGAEYAALKDFNFRAFDIDVISVENNYGDEKLRAVLHAAKFDWIHRLGGDDIYRKRRK